MSDARSLSFDFITDESFRSTLEADVREMRTCADAQAWKAVHVLAGSIVEAVLVDYLVGTGQTKPDPLSMSLADLISAGKKAGVLSAKTAELAGALKAYRNMIHPGRAKRLNEHVDEDGGVVAQALVSIIVREVADSQQKTYGLTAEQIVNKFESDPTALGIAHHLLSDASDREVERLLLRVLPTRYFEAAEQEYPDEKVLNGHAQLFRVALRSAPETAKATVLARYVAVLKEEPGPRVQAYEEEFFRASDLDYVAVADRDMVKAHLLARLRDDPNARLLRATKGIGPFLAAADVTRFVDPLVG